ncbi:hypothetical protein FOMPIDRAFT_1046537 [Fomitopsis schrenkii]|uniref:DUF6532 domain-containing protein n=1 Tax=Fomitopsis schrenkii TaxID=2126942 RepID=S8EG28_FOMSC|nr:hypothetical protein FOMPIDRAFT_1046537 [Fomitopsis schrenkii]
MPSSPNSGHNLRSKSKNEPKKRPPAPKASAKDNSTKTSGSTGKSVGKKRQREESDPEESTDEGVLTKDDEKLLKRLQAKKLQATKKKEAERKNRVQQASTAMAMDEQSSADEEEDEDHDVSSPKRKKFKQSGGRRNIEESIDDADQDEEQDVNQADGSGADDEQATSPRRRPGGRNQLDEDEARIAQGLGSNVLDVTPSPGKTRSGRARNRQGQVEVEVVVDTPTKSKGRKKNPTREQTVRKERSEPKKRPGWLATSASDYDDGEHATQDELDELESSRDKMEESSEGEVVVVQSSKDKGKSKGRRKGRKSRAKDDDSKGDSRGRAMLRELPVEVRSVVTRANSFLRLRISLENAWTAERKFSHTLLPEKDMIVKRAINDVWQLRDDDGKSIKNIELGFKVLNDEKNEDIRSDIFTLLWTGAPQLRNQVKKEAKSVVEDAYGLKNLSAVQRVSAAQFLLRYNQQGNHAIPNFVFDNVDLCWMDDDVDTKASTVNRKRPFQHLTDFSDRESEIFDELIEAAIGEPITSIPETASFHVCSSMKFHLRPQRLSLPIVTCDVLTPYPEEDVIVHPFRDWPQSPCSHDVCTGVCDVSVESGIRGSSKCCIGVCQVLIL